MTNELTKRERFASIAMQGLLSSQTSEYGYIDDQTVIVRDEKGGVQYDKHGEIIVNLVKTSERLLAEDAVRQADALIDALNEESK